MKTCKEYRLQAAEAMHGNYGCGIGMLLVYSLIISGLGAAGGVGYLILGGMFEVGVAIAFVNLYRQGSLNFGDLFSGFRKVNFGSTIGLTFFTALFTFLWSLLFVVPGIIAACSYAMAPYIMADHPELSARGCITASKELMRGKKGRYFCLGLSYIGWYLLAILTFGILTLWIEPKVRAAYAAFYEDIKHEVPGYTADGTNGDESFKSYFADKNNQSSDTFTGDNPF